MSSISSNFFLIILFIILKSVTVWSSNLDKIKIIEEDIYLNNFEFFNYENKPVKILDNKDNYYISKNNIKLIVPDFLVNLKKDEITDKDIYYSLLLRRIPSYSYSYE